MAEKKTYRAVRFNADASVKVEEIEFPTLTDNTILIKVEAGSVNPVDQAMVVGQYPAAPKAPYTLGLEGSGTVVEVGKEHASRFKIGDRVAFLSDGTYGSWAQYALISGNRVFPIHPDNTFDEAAPHYINPMTALLMFREFQREGHKAFVQSGANSALGKMLIKLAKDHGIKTINIVRRDDAKEELLKIGADYVLNSQDADFEQKLEEVAKKESATKFFDCVSGEFTVKVLRKLPYGSSISIFGLLSGDINLPVTTLDLFAGKRLSAFIVTTHFESLSPEGRLKEISYIQEKLKTTFHTKVIKTFGLEGFGEALEHTRKNASDGKTLIKPW